MAVALTRRPEPEAARDPSRHMFHATMLVTRAEESSRDFVHLGIDLDTVDRHAGVEAPIGSSHRPARIADHEHSRRRSVEERWQEQKQIPVAAGQDGVPAPHRMDNHALVQLEIPLAVVVLNDADVLVLRFGLVEAPLHVAGRKSEQSSRHNWSEEPATAHEDARRDGEDDGRADERPLGADERDQHKGAEECPGQAAGGRERIQASRDLSRLGDAVEREAERERRHRPQCRDRDGEEGDRGEERTDDGSDRERVEALHGDLEKRPRGERRLPPVSCCARSSGTGDPRSSRRR